MNGLILKVRISLAVRASVRLLLGLRSVVGVRV